MIFSRNTTRTAIGQSLAVGLLSSFVLACGSGGPGQPAGSGPIQPPPPPPPPVGEVNFSQTAYQVSESTTTVEFMVTRSNGSAGEVTIDITTGDGTALAGQDYGSITTTATFGDGETGSKTGGVVIFNDTVDEADETFELSLVNGTGGINLGSVSAATVTIIDDDGSVPTPVAGNPINDTGVTGCADGVASNLPCDAGTAAYPGQDAEVGRDVTDNDDSDGRAGFSFTKLDANGAPLPDQAGDYDTDPWDCVEDRTTGLTWEVKTNDDGMRHRDWEYSWYSERTYLALDTPEGGTCHNSLPNCDTDAFTEAVNNLALCGFTDWRLPTRHELLSLVDFGAVQAPSIDQAYFPNTVRRGYWSSSQPPFYDQAWLVIFNDNGLIAAPTTDAHVVRLVRGGI